MSAKGIPVRLSPVGIYQTFAYVAYVFKAILEIPGMRRPGISGARLGCAALQAQQHTPPRDMPGMQSLASMSSPHVEESLP